jgi:shikimate kinase
MHEIDLRRRVVAPGGSIIYISGLMEYLKQNSTLVYLCNSFDDIETRLSDRASRGIVGLRNKSLREVYDERGSLYSKYADFTVNCKGKTADQIAREILNYFAQKN